MSKKEPIDIGEIDGIGDFALPTVEDVFGKEFDPVLLTITSVRIEPSQYGPYAVIEGGYNHPKDGLVLLKFRTGGMVLLKQLGRVYEYTIQKEVISAYLVSVKTDVGTYYQLLTTKPQK